MGSAGEDEAAGRSSPSSPARPRPDRLAEALRANLKRRKAQTRARDEARPEVSAPDADARERG